MRFKHIGIIGAGGWGTALALVATQSEAKVTIWGRDAKHITAMDAKRENSHYLAGVELPVSLTLTSSLDDLADCDLVLAVAPAQCLREVFERLSEWSPRPLVIASKGIEKESNALMSEVVASVLPSFPVSILSGPNFADEVAQGLPAATTIACEDVALGQAICQALSYRRFRCYQSQDMVGVQIGGAVKNVLAIASGVAHGRGLGENAKAALITRGIYEMGQLSVAKGGKQETFLGLSGIGDVLLSCNNLKSRNMALGNALGQGKSLATIKKENASLTEGVATSLSVNELAQQLKIDMPICQTMKRVLHDGLSVDEAVGILLDRPVGKEEI